jgi:hypothetical protein
MILLSTGLVAALFAVGSHEYAAALSVIHKWPNVGATVSYLTNKVQNSNPG